MVHFDANLKMEGKAVCSELSGELTMPAAREMLGRFAKQKGDPAEYSYSQGSSTESFL